MTRMGGWWPPAMILGMLMVVGSSASLIGTLEQWKNALVAEVFPASQSNGRSTNIVLPLQGNVYPNGFYNATLYIGQPPRPYFLDVDTGSDLTWLQCDAPCVTCTETAHPLYYPSDSKVSCMDPLCSSLHPSGEHICEVPDQCDYVIEYADGGSSLGVLLNDAFLLNSTSGKRLNPLLALGCGYDQLPGRAGSPHPIDGVLGLGRGQTSIVTQLNKQGIVKHVLGHCLSSHGGGFLFFGDGIYDSSRVTWRPMPRHQTKHYSPGVAEMYFGGKATGLRHLQVVMDSGSSYTYLRDSAYHVLISLLKENLEGKPLGRAADDRTLPFCWRGRKPFKSIRDVRKYFSSWALSFEGGKARSQFEFKPEDYLIISLRGNACLGILNGTEAGLGRLNVIGDISMQEKLVIYDNEKHKIGWVHANCNRLPK